MHNTRSLGAGFDGYRWYGVRYDDPQRREWFVVGDGTEGNTGLLDVGEKAVYSIALDSCLRGEMVLKYALELLGGEVSE